MFHNALYLILTVVCWMATVYCLGVLLLWAFRKRWIGALTLDASACRPQFQVWIIAGYLVLWLASIWVDPHSLFSIKAAIMLPIMFSLLVGGTLEIHERGLFSDCWLIPWQRIKRWSLNDKGGSPTTYWSGVVKPKPGTVRVELRRPLLFVRSITVIVPFDKVDIFCQALEKNLHAA